MLTILFFVFESSDILGAFYSCYFMYILTFTGFPWTLHPIITMLKVNGLWEMASQSIIAKQSEPIGSPYINWIIPLIVLQRTIILTTLLQVVQVINKLFKALSMTGALKLFQCLK